MGECQMKQSSLILALAPPLRQWFYSIHSPVYLKCSPSFSSGWWPKQPHDVSVPCIRFLCPCECCLTEMAHGKMSGELWSMAGDRVIPSQVWAHFLHLIILSPQRADTLWQKNMYKTLLWVWVSQCGPSVGNMINNGAWSQDQNCGSIS